MPYNSIAHIVQPLPTPPKKKNIYKEEKEKGKIEMNQTEPARLISQTKQQQQKKKKLLQ